ncbi:MAG: hypothetical protein GYB31_14950 [Bacteroidetes bacterium]|nr:hypothetical protein [Bacteroidota bacterium]
MLKFVRSVNQTLWQNRRILEKCWKSNMQQLHVSQLERMGFKFSRLTDLLQDGLHCCYDYGFRFGEENMVEIQPYREKDITDEVC